MSTTLYGRVVPSVDDLESPRSDAVTAQPIDTPADDAPDVSFEVPAEALMDGAEPVPTVQIS